ncbi:uncharacterized protein [Acropora muricata]|uniref:uncharacterized protein n=1 Tax=Acropora muricata TaxID=159855 RepID=UPI0034E4CC19
MWSPNSIHLNFLFCSFLFPYFEFAEGRSCFMEDWGSNFRKDDETSCEGGGGYYYLVGFERDGTNNLNGIKRAKCCARDQTFWNIPTQCQMPDWIRSLDGAGRSACQQGFFLRGVYRSNGNSLGHIEWGKCCKPSHHPYQWGDCYNEDVSGTFNKAGLSECRRDGYFITGFETTSGGALSSIKKFKCCRMVEEIPTLTTMDELKQRVMDATMFNIGQLASMMGFAWSGGCWAKYSGEDFRRKGDTWESHYANWCTGDGPKKNVRLKITYSNFDFAMKDVIFGESIKQTISLEQESQLVNSPDRSYKKIACNKKNTAGTSEVGIDVRSARTLKNVKTSSWDANIGIEVGVEYQPPSTTGGVGFSAKTSFKYEWGGEQEDSTTDQDWHILMINEKKQLPPKTFSKWSAFKKPQKVTIPYTATIVPKFKVKLEGYMVWGGGYDGNNPNFHHKHRGSGDRKKIEYTFGNDQKPFYEDLKEQIDENKYPWQWHALLQRYPYAEYFINQLIDPDFYAFTLTGQFEESTEIEVKSTWFPSRPIEEMEAAVANSTLLTDQATEPIEFPRVLPAPPKVKIIDNKKEAKPPISKHFNDNDRNIDENLIHLPTKKKVDKTKLRKSTADKKEKYQDTDEEFPRIRPPPPKVKPIDNKEEMKPPPAKNDENYAFALPI